MTVGRSTNNMLAAGKGCWHKCHCSVAPGLWLTRPRILLYRAGISGGHPASATQCNLHNLNQLQVQRLLLGLRDGGKYLHLSSGYPVVYFGEKRMRASQDSTDQLPQPGRLRAGVR